MELGIREWMIIIGVLLLIAVLLDGIRKMRAERRNHIRVAFKMGGGVCDENGYVDPVDREVSKPRVVKKTLPGTPGKASSDSSSKPVAKDKPVAKEKRRSSKSLKEHQRIEPHLDDLASQQSANEVIAPIAANQESDNEATATSGDKAIADGKPGNIAELTKAKAEQASTASSEASHYDLADEFIPVYVVSRDEQGFNGADLLQILLACDLRFGKRNIFHRHEYKNGTGPVQFSMANIVEPGVFDLNTIESFQTPGVCFFTSLPGPEDPLKAFDYMVETANCIARNLNGELRDENRSAVTPQTLSHYRQRVQEFERRQLMMTV